eukprot:2117777-Rhodomonas_salina.1
MVWKGIRREERSCDKKQLRKKPQRDLSAAPRSTWRGRGRGGWRRRRKVKREAREVEPTGGSTEGEEGWQGGTRRRSQRRGEGRKWRGEESRRRGRRRGEGGGGVTEVETEEEKSTEGSTEEGGERSRWK